MKSKFKIIILGLCFISTNIFADTMTISQSVVFEGFEGATFMYVKPSNDAIICDDKASEITYSFPNSLPAQDPNIDKYSIINIVICYG